MAELPHPWGIYAQTQAQLSSSAKLNHSSDGLEAGLNALLTATDLSGFDITMMSRAINSGARRSRYGCSLLVRNAADMGSDAHDPEGCLEARADLRRLEGILGASVALVLTAIAEGHDYQHLASMVGLSPEALRAKVSRGRRAARAALAH